MGFRSESRVPKLNTMKGTTSTPPTCSMSFPSFYVRIFRIHSRNSQDGSSEEIIGEWAEARGNRDQLVIATKARIYSSSFSQI
jgi:hypothetical protein